MKQIKHIAVVCLLAFFSLAANAQSNPGDNGSSIGMANYAVPESPAFKILGVTPTAIMRPATTRELGLSFGNTFLESGTSIPKNFALEVSPLLFRPAMNLDKYKKKYAWYNTGFSLGTTISQNGSYAVATGVRVKIIDKSDLRTNETFKTFIDACAKNYLNAYSLAREKAQADLSMNKVEFSEAENDINNPKHSQVMMLIATYKNQFADESLIIKKRDSLRNASWNALVLEAGVATLFTSKDSLIKNLSTLSNAGLWISSGFPVTKKGQLLLGVNYQMVADSANNYMSALAIGTRFYYGSNNLKAFLEVEDKSLDFKSESNTLTARLGLETTFGYGLWFDLSLGIQKTGTQKAIFAPALNLKFGTPEKH